MDNSTVTLLDFIKYKSGSGLKHEDLLELTPTRLVLSPEIRDLILGERLAVMFSSCLFCTSSFDVLPSQIDFNALITMCGIAWRTE